MKHVDDFIDDPTSDRYAACGHLEYHCPASGCNHIEVTVEGPNGETEDCDCDGFVKKELS